MSKSFPKLKVVFAGCVRDCAISLPSVLHNIERMASLYVEAAFIFVENDSKDHTKEIIKSWCGNKKNASLITLDGLASLQPVRTIRLAKCASRIYRGTKGTLQRLFAFNRYRLR